MKIAISPACCPGDSGCSTGSSTEERPAQSPPEQSSAVPAVPVQSSPAALDSTQDIPKSGSEGSGKKAAGKKEGAQVVAPVQSPSPTPLSSDLSLPAESSSSSSSTSTSVFSPPAQISGAIQPMTSGNLPAKFEDQIGKPLNGTYQMGMRNRPLAGLVRTQ